MRTELTRSPTQRIQPKQQNAELRKRCIDRHYALFQQQKQYLEIWKDIRDYELPYDGIFDDDQPGKPNLHDDHIYSNIASMSRDIFAAGIQSGLTPPSRKWFRYTLADMTLNDNNIVKRVLDQRCDITEYVFAQSNFYNAIHTAYRELPFGQAPLGIFANARGITFASYPIGTYALGTNAHGRINVFARKVKMTAAQIVALIISDPLPVVNGAPGFLPIFPPFSEKKAADAVPDGGTAPRRLHRRGFLARRTHSGSCGSTRCIRLPCQFQREVKFAT